MKTVWNLDYPRNNITLFLHEWYWYTPGNILRSDYYNQQGFWLVLENKVMRRCDEEGNIYPEGHIRYATRTGSYNEAWFWRDMNEGLQPVLDTFNKQKRVFYQFHTDEMVEERDRIKTLECEQRANEYTVRMAVATPLEFRMERFDWSFEYADQFYPGKHDERASIFAGLEAMDYDSARKSWDTYGPYRGRETDCSYGQPNWAKCSKS